MPKTKESPHVTKEANLGELQEKKRAEKKKRIEEKKKKRAEKKKKRVEERKKKRIEEKERETAAFNAELKFRLEIIENATKEELEKMIPILYKAAFPRG